jgi:NTP pyrophosphatase (non-canonical NTP hydrolase)
MADIQSTIDRIIDFRDKRDWAQFHNAKDLAIAISVEAAELNELFLWKSAEEVDPGKLKEELADILTFCLLLAYQQDLDIQQIIEEKLVINAAKYPIAKAKGSAKKYNEL